MVVVSFIVFIYLNLFSVKLELMKQLEKKHGRGLEIYNILHLSTSKIILALNMINMTNLTWITLLLLSISIHKQIHPRMHQTVNITDESSKGVFSHLQTIFTPDFILLDLSSSTKHPISFF